MQRQMKNSGNPCFHRGPCGSRIKSVSLYLPPCSCNPFTYVVGACWLYKLQTNNRHHLFF